MKNQETIQEFAQRVLDEAQFDVNTQYCVDNGIKYNNNEVDASTIELFTSESNKAAFDFISK